MGSPSSWGFILFCEASLSFSCLLRWIPVLHQKTGLNCAGRAPIPFQLSSCLWKTAQALHGTALERFWLGYPEYKRSAWLADVLSSPGCHVERHPNRCYIFGARAPNHFPFNRTLKDGVTRAAETARSLPAPLYVLHKTFFSQLPPLAHVPGVRSDSDTKTQLRRCGKIKSPADQPNKLVGVARTEAGETRY